MSKYEYTNTYTILATSDLSAALVQKINTPQHNHNYVDTSNMNISEFCSYEAQMNNSPYYLLNDTSNCYIYDIYKANNRESGVNSVGWLSRLSDCSVNPCSKTVETSTGEYTYGVGENNYSLYSKKTTYNSEFHYVSIDNYKEQFERIYSGLLTDISALSNLYRSYREEWYSDVSINEASSTVAEPTTPRYLELAELYGNKYLQVESKLLELLELRIFMENTLSDLNGDVVNNLNKLQIIDKKIQIAQKYVNGLMANSSGAIGMLKDNKYNSMVLITENTVMALIIISLVYVYFRNNG